MRTILFILQKEFIQVFRNKTMLPIIFLLPIFQLLILVYAATLEMKSIPMIVVDYDLSPSSRSLINKFEGSPFYILKGYTTSMDEAESSMLAGEADLIIHIPEGFEEDLIKTGTTDLQILINAINSTAAGLINAYTTGVISDFNREIITENINLFEIKPRKNIDVDYSFWYNPYLNYKIYMLPGILVILVTVIGMFLTALNLVREKELGTIEQINVTPIRKYQFIAGKLVPFWIIATFELALGLALGKLLFDIPMLGSLPLLFGFTSAYLLLVLSLGLFISAISGTQQQVMFVAFFFMITFIMMSGIFTPAESMPDWAQDINIINPLAYFMKVIRMILLKGATFVDIAPEFISVSILAIIMMSMAVWRYRKVAA